MDTSAGPYLVTTHDPTYRAMVGYLGNCGYYFRVLDGLDEDAHDIEVDSGGLDGELAHLVQLLEVSTMYVDWSQHTAVLRELTQHDGALTSKIPRVRRLLRDALVT